MAIEQGASWVSFGYDGDQTRIRKTTPKEETLYVEGLYERVTQMASAQTEHRYFIHAPERVVAVASVTGVGTVPGVLAVAGSAVLVAGGIANVMTGAERLGQALSMSSGSGSSGPQGPPPAAGTGGQPSRALGRALESAGHVRPPGSAAHHIVAHSARDAAPARSVLQKFRININEAANGVFLPSAQHAALHTQEYYTRVNTALTSATTREQVINALQSIGQALQSGTFP
jgi:hypothetical protein